MDSQRFIHRCEVALRITAAALSLQQAPFALATGSEHQSGCAVIPSAAAEAEGTRGYEAAGKTHLDEDFSISFRERLYQVEQEAYKKKELIYKEHMLGEHIAALAAKSKESPEHIKEKLLGVERPKEKEMKDFFENHKDSLPSAHYDDMKSGISRHLYELAAAQKKNELIKQLESKQKFKILGKVPRAVVHKISTGEAPTKGAQKPKVTVIKFSDFYCGYCKVAAKMLKEVLSEHSQDLAVIYMPYGVFGEASDQLSREAYCAHKQDKFWQFHDKAFALGNQKLESSSGKAIAQELKLDMKKFDSCVESASSAAFVKMVKDAGTQLGVQATPTLFINGVRARLSALKQEVKEALQKSSS